MPDGWGLLVVATAVRTFAVFQDTRRSANLTLLWRPQGTEEPVPTATAEDAAGARVGLALLLRIHLHLDLPGLPLAPTLTTASPGPLARLTTATVIYRGPSCL